MNTLDSKYLVRVPGADVWVEEVLASCKLGRLLLAHVLEDAWVAFAPSKVSTSRLQRFRAGALFANDEDVARRDAYAMLTRLIHAQLEGSVRNVALMYDMCASPEDRWLEKKRAEFVTYEGVVYHVARHGDREAAIQMRVRHAERLPYFFGAVGFIDATLPRAGAELTPSQFSAFARSVSFVFVGAYDGESFLFWERSNESNTDTG